MLNLETKYDFLMEINKWNFSYPTIKKDVMFLIGMVWETAYDAGIKHGMHLILDAETQADIEEKEVVNGEN